MNTYIFCYCILVLQHNGKSSTKKVLQITNQNGVITQNIVLFSFTSHFNIHLEFELLAEGKHEHSEQAVLTGGGIGCLQNACLCCYYLLH
jgi:hypothetical protein